MQTQTQRHKISGSVDIGRIEPYRSELVSLQNNSSNLRKTIDWKNQFNTPLVSTAIKNAYDEETTFDT